MQTHQIPKEVQSFTELVNWLASHEHNHYFVYFVRKIILSHHKEPFKLADIVNDIAADVTERISLTPDEIKKLKKFLANVLHNVVQKNLVENKIVSKKEHTTTFRVCLEERTELEKMLIAETMFSQKRKRKARSINKINQQPALALNNEQVLVSAQNVEAETKIPDWLNSLATKLSCLAYIEQRVLNGELLIIADLTKRILSACFSEYAINNRIKNKLYYKIQKLLHKMLEHGLIVLVTAGKNKTYQVVCHDREAIQLKIEQIKTQETKKAETTLNRPLKKLKSKISHEQNAERVKHTRKLANDDRVNRYRSA